MQKLKFGPSWPRCIILRCSTSSVAYACFARLSFVTLITSERCPNNRTIPALHASASSKNIRSPYGKTMGISDKQHCGRPPNKKQQSPIDLNPQATRHPNESDDNRPCPRNVYPNSGWTYKSRRWPAIRVNKNSP